MTDKEKIKKAFVHLRNVGYFARMNFMCCQGCGWAAVPKGKKKKVVFYHKQDADSFDDNGNLKRHMFLAWAGDKKIISEILKMVGLKVKVPKNENTRVELIGYGD